MASKKSFWYQLGHAYERARQSVPERRGSGAVARRDGAGPPSRVRDGAGVPGAEELVATGIALVADRVLGRWSGRARPGVLRLVRAGAAGATAALLLDLVRPLLRGDMRTGIDADTVDRLIAGAGQGLLYGAVVDPRLPGHPVVKGALYGSVEYWMDPLGGLGELLGGHAPHRHLPVLGEAMGSLTDQDRAYVEHVVFGITLALLYESRSASSGILSDDE